MKKRKLRLHRETIRRLDSDQLGRVAGGAHTDEFTCDCYSNPTWCNCDTTEYSCGGDTADTRPQSICNSCGAGCTQMC